jgi:hypothetical protein
MPIVPPEHIGLTDRTENLPPPARKKVFSRDHGTPKVLSDQLTRGLTENNVNLLERLVLRLGHEQNLVEPANDSDTAIESKGETNLRHSGLHFREEISNEEGAEEQSNVAGLHAVRTEVGGVDLGGDNPGETGIGSEETFIDDETGDVGSLGAGFVGEWYEIGAADDDEADKETGEHGTGPDFGMISIVTSS